MSNEEMRKLIVKAINQREDEEYLLAELTFARYYGLEREKRGDSRE